jgi:hypothetical protein
METRVQEQLIAASLRNDFSNATYSCPYRRKLLREISKPDGINLF